MAPCNDMHDGYDMQGRQELTCTNTDGAQRQGFRKVLRLRLITIRISDEVAESEPMEVETLRSSKGKSMRRSKAPQNYDQCSALQITCNGISNEIVPRIMRDIQTLNQDIQRYT
eukprot:378624_1